MKLLDTDAILEMLREKKYEYGAISVITLIETLRGVNPKKRDEVKKLLEESFKVIDLDNSIIRTYCDLYQRLKEEGSQIPDADLIIAATAITHNMTLRSKDRHFLRLREIGLKLETTR